MCHDVSSSSNSSVERLSRRNLSIYCLGTVQSRRISTFFLKRSPSSTRSMHALRPELSIDSQRTSSISRLPNPNASRRAGVDIRFSNTARSTRIRLTGMTGSTGVISAALEAESVFALDERASRHFIEFCLWLSSSFLVLKKLRQPRQR